MAMMSNEGGGWRASRWRIAMWGCIAFLLLLPLVAMQFTDEVKWDAFDFVFMGTLMGGVGLGFELAVRKTGNASYRAAAGLALAAVFLLVWINGAVGIIGSENNPANLMYAGVLGIAIVGAIVARFRPQGLALALTLTALAQALAGVIALATGAGATGESWPRDVIVLTGFFSTMWLGSAWLFRKAARWTT